LAKIQAINEKSVENIISEYDMAKKFNPTIVFSLWIQRRREFFQKFMERHDTILW